MTDVTALVSAYYAEPFMHRRLTNLKGVDTIVVCQKDSVEHRIAFEYDVQIITTPDIPTIGKAWNLAARRATGDYLTTANTDDMFVGHGLDILSMQARRAKADVCFSSVFRHGIPWKRIIDKQGFIRNAAQRLQKKCFIGPMPLWKRSLHSKFGWFDETMTVASDYDFWLRLARGGATFYYIDMPLGVYTVRKDSLEHRNKHLLAQETKQVRKGI